MKAGKTMKKLCAPPGRSDGFSMTELVVALAVAVLVGLGIYSVYVSQQRQSTSQRLYNDLQNNLRFAMDYMKNELYLAGFKATDALQPVSTATAGSVTFEYWDDNAEMSPPYDKHVQVTYSLSGNDLVRTALKYNTTPGIEDYDPSTTVNQVLAGDVTALAFGYRKGNDQPYTIGTDSPDEIRTVRITLRGRSRRPDPVLKDPGTGGDYHRTLTLTGEVKSRNLAIASNPFDETAPAVPSGLNVWDPKQCGRLMMQWNANTDPDLAGYTVFYGLSPGNYSNRVRLSRGPGGPGDKVGFTLTELTTIDAPYYVTVTAFDRSANVSAMAPEVSADPATDVTSPGGGNDTTVNPAIPLPPGSFAPTMPSDGQVQLNWTPSNSVGVVGYRLFRATQPDYSDEVPLADESLLDADSTGYLDENAPGNILKGCETYYYRIAAIHCNPEDFNNGLYTDSDYAVLSAAPTDGTPPRVPLLVARPGFQRIILNLKNPSREATEDPDFTFTEIYWQTAGYPSIAADGTVSGELIPDYNGQVAIEGSVPPINFDSETVVYPSVPELQPDQTYYFLAVAYDSCGNHTEETSEAMAEGQQCGDCNPGEPCDEVPLGQAPSYVGVSGCDYSIDLSWSPADEILYRDHAGYRVFRQEGQTFDESDGSRPIVELTGGNATWFPSWEDSIGSAHPMQFGKSYSYRVCATDCYYEQHHDKSPGDWPDPADDPADNIECYTIDAYHGNGPLYVGTFRQSTAANKNQPVTGDIVALPPTFRHNTVTYWIDNLAAGPLTQDAIRMSWTEPEDFLSLIEIGDNQTTSYDAFYIVPPVVTGNTVSFSPPKRIDGIDTEVPVAFSFTRLDGSVERRVNPDGTVDPAVDLRQESIDPHYFFRNDSTGSSSCTYRENRQVYVPLGVVVTGVVQDQPLAPTPAWAVPGDNDTNVADKVIVKGNRDVTVRAVVLEDPILQTPVLEVVLRYFVDSAASGMTPSPADFSNVIPMRQVGDTNEYVTVTPIPAVSDARVWFSIVGVDIRGAFDRSPEIDSGAYTYYQQPPDVCDDTPEPPILAGSSTSGSVTLTWTPPLYSTDPEIPGTPLPFSDPGGYNIYRNDGTGWKRIPPISGPANGPTVDEFTTSFMESLADIDSRTYSYYVTAIDQCTTPKPNESGPSGVFTECEGGAACTIALMPSGSVPMFPGDEFTITMNLCERQNGTPDEIVYVQTCSKEGADADSVQLVEDGDTGTFRINPMAFDGTPEDYSGRDAVTLHFNSQYPPTPIDLDLRVPDSGYDTVIVGGWQDTPFDDDLCQESLFSCGPADVGVTPDPCLYPVVPEPPETLLVESAGNCSASREVALSWSPSPTPEVTEYEVFQCADFDCAQEWIIGTTTETTFGPYSVGGKLLLDSYFFRIKAVNRGCPTNVQRGSQPAAVEDPC